MSSATNAEHHFTGAATVRDIVIGMSDGLTVPFALAAGLSGAVASTGIVVTAGFAEIAAGAISMGLGGYLAAKTELEHYDTERLREARETEEIPEREAEEVAEIFRGYGLSEAQVTPVVNALRADPGRWVDFMMRFELGLERPNARRAKQSALTIGLSYIVGGLIPLIPYLLVKEITLALGWSVGTTAFALFGFGCVKGHFTGISAWRTGVQTLLVGGLAATVAFTIAKFIS